MARFSLGCVARRSLAALLLVASVSCEKKAPPDPHVVQGYALLRADAAAALKEFAQARDPERLDAVLGRALAFEGLRRYRDAKAALEKVEASGDADVGLALTRVAVMLGEVDAARARIAGLVRLAPKSRSVLLVEACLATDEPRARASLQHIDAWLAASRSTDPPEVPPAEVPLARASLLALTGAKEAALAELSTARKRWFSSPEEALSLAVLAGAAGNAPLAGSLLDKLMTSDISEPVRLGGARLALRLGKLPLVKDALVALSSGNPETRRLRARYDLATNAPEAPSSLARALEVTQDPDEKVELTLALADVQLKAGHLDEARATTEALLASQPGAPGAQLVLARVELSAGRGDAALETLAPLLAGEPPEGAREVAALAHLGEGRRAEARPFVVALLEKNPSHHLAAKLLIAIDLASGRSKDVATDVEALVRRAPRDLTLRLLWADLLRKLGDSATRIRALREGIALTPKEPRLWLELYRHHASAEERAQALATLEEGLRENPDNPLIGAALAAELTKAGRGAEAAPLYDLVLRHSAKDVVALNNLALLYVDELRDVAKGVELAEKAHELAPTEPAVIDTLGWALYRRGTPEDLSRARTLLESVQGRLRSPTFDFHLGATWLALGKVPEGKALLERALRAPEGFTAAPEATRLLGRGT